jgi:hypothetical protein
MRFSGGSKMFRFFLLNLIVFMLIFTVDSPLAYCDEVRLAWDASPDPSVIGYKIYRGTSTGIYDYEKDVGKVTSTVITGLDAGADYYFSATGYNSQREESDFCNEVTIPARNIDTDNDGILDSIETNVYGTDPHNPDSDGDGIVDGDELANGSDPLSPNPSLPGSDPPSHAPHSSDGLVALYDFNEGGGSTVQDISGIGTPLDLNIVEPGMVTWEAGGGLTINASTAIRSSGPATKIINAIKSSQELTIEAWLTPGSTTQYGPARIVALSGDAYPTGGNFVLGAGPETNRAAYDVRLRTSETNQYGRPSLTSPDGAVTTELTHIAYTRESSGRTRLFIDGILTAEHNSGGNFSNWGSYALGLGNEPYPEKGDRTWLGTMHVVAIYDRALSSTDIALNFAAGPTLRPANQTPVASNDAYSVTEGMDLIIEAYEGVLSNDSDPDGDPLAASLVGGPANGHLELFEDGSFSYTPFSGYSGSDSFTYQPTDGYDNGNVATVSINVTTVSQVPDWNWWRWWLQYAF